ncbi:MAG: dockerin type I repeat-containing protein [Clostridia bacterium]|nr:dockerin type I repeat-containing protein [Clostridia bacterium]
MEASAAHSFGDWIVTQEPTCVKTGIKTRTCAGCGLEETKTVKKTDHDYIADIHAPTCTEDGFTIYICSVCDKSYTEIGELATGHKYSLDWEHDYTMHYHMCSVCGEAVEKEKHNFVWIIDQEADIDIDGRQHEQCSVCGYARNYNTIIPSLPNTTSPMTVPATTVTTPETTEQTSTEASTTEAPATTEPETTAHIYSNEWQYDADSHWQACIYCDNKINSSKHTFEKIVVKDATRYEDGIIHCVCSVCGYVEYIETIPHMTFPDEPETYPTSSQTLGDLNGDGKVNSADARIALRIAARLETASEIQKQVGDVNHDGRINSADARMILRVAARLDTFK